MYCRCVAICLLSTAAVLAFLSSAEVAAVKDADTSFISLARVLLCWMIWLICCRYSFSPSTPIFGPIFVAIDSPHPHGFVKCPVFLLSLGLGPVIDGKAGDHIKHLAISRAHDLLPPHIQPSPVEEEPGKVQLDSLSLPLSFFSGSTSTVVFLSSTQAAIAACCSSMNSAGRSDMISSTLRGRGL